MIRINLASSSAQTAALGGGASAGEGSGEGSAEVRKQAIMKLLVMLILPGGLFAYEQQNIPSISATLQQKQVALNEIETFNTKAANAVEEIKKFKEDEKKIQSRIAILEHIAKDRFREVKVLDLFQQVIPERVWFTKVDIHDGKILLTGFSTSDYDISGFMESLSKSIYLQDVVLVSSSEQTVDSAILKKFEISCALEKSADKTGVHQ